MSTRMYAMVKDMLKHVYNMNEMSLSDMLEIAFEMYPVRVVCSDIIAPMMSEIGSLWERGELMVVMEHFASNVVISKLKSMLHKQNTTTNKNGPTVFVGCAPEEYHEIGALIVAFFMSVNGWKVVYLGQNIPVTDIYNIVDTMDVHAIALSASNERTLSSLKAIGTHIVGRSKQKQVEFLVGGRLLVNPGVLETIPGATTRTAEDMYSYCPPTHATHTDTLIRGALDGSYSLIKESYRKMRLASERRKRTQFLLDQISREYGDEDDAELVDDMADCDLKPDDAKITDLADLEDTGPIIEDVTEEEEKKEKERAKQKAKDKKKEEPEEIAGSTETDQKEEEKRKLARYKTMALDEKRKLLEERIEKQRAQTAAIKQRLMTYKEGKNTIKTNPNPELAANRLVSGKFVPKKRHEGAETEEGVKYTPPVDHNRLVGKPKKAEPFTKFVHLHKPFTAVGEPTIAPTPTPSKTISRSSIPPNPILDTDPTKYYPKYTNLPEMSAQSSDSGSSSGLSDDGDPEEGVS